MAQAITDVKTFLEDARQAVVELAEFENRRRRLLRKRKSVCACWRRSGKAVADAVNSTVKSAGMRLKKL